MRAGRKDKKKRKKKGKKEKSMRGWSRYLFCNGDQVQRCPDGWRRGTLSTSLFTRAGLRFYGNIRRLCYSNKWKEEWKPWEGFFLFPFISLLTQEKSRNLSGCLFLFWVFFFPRQISIHASASPSGRTLNCKKRIPTFAYLLMASAAAQPRWLYIKMGRASGFKKRTPTPKYHKPASHCLASRGR